MMSFGNIAASVNNRHTAMHEPSLSNDLPAIFQNEYRAIEYTNTVTPPIFVSIVIYVQLTGFVTVTSIRMKVTLSRPFYD